MPPKVKISREEIINAAIEIVRVGGEVSLNARNLASLLGCSTQPIFSNFKTMEELQSSVLFNAEELFIKFLNDEIKKSDYPLYKAGSMAYIRFAKCENNIFKFLFLQNNVSTKLRHKIESLIILETGLSGDTARLFYLEMWAFVQGMAVMSANDKFPLHGAVICQMFDDAYEGIKTRFMCDIN